MKSVKILVTGGTIDKVHDTFSEGLDFPKDGTSQIPKILLDSRCHFADVQILMMKDSLDFDDADRDAIVAAVEAAAEDAIVVTHGTGTMGESATLVGRACHRQDGCLHRRHAASFVKCV